MTQLHRDGRAKLGQRQAIEWDSETRARQSRLPTGLRGFWHRITGTYQDIRRQNEDEAQRTRDRHAAERQALVDRQREQRAVLQADFKELRREQAEQLLALRKDIGRCLRFSKSLAADAGRVRRADIGLRLER